MPTSIRGRIVLEILEGMVYLTENNVIHKDLKPENILVDQDFHIKVDNALIITGLHLCVERRVCPCEYLTCCALFYVKPLMHFIPLTEATRF